MPNYLEVAKRWIQNLTELGLLLVALFVVVHILFGPSTPFIGGVVQHLLDLVAALGNAGLVGLIAVGIILWLFQKRAA
jgi:hypothetical protein